MPNDCPRTRNDHELFKFTEDSCVRVTQCENDIWNVAISQVTSASLTNLASPGTANTEFSHTFATTTKRFRIRSRNRTTLKYTYTSGESGTTYFTIIPGNIYEEEQVDFSGGVTIYLQSNKAGDTIEIIEWS